MASFVGAFGVPHTPVFAQVVKREGPTSETGRLFADVRQALLRARPDLLLMFDTDHLNTFFLDNLPMLAVGVADQFCGPNDEPPELPTQTVQSCPALARHVRNHCVRNGYDIALVQEFSVDHSVMIPLHLLTPEMTTPVVPVFINGHVAPLPTAERAFAFGRSVRAAIDSFRDDVRVAIVGSGSFSLEVYGPRIRRGTSFGVPDPAWAARVEALLREGAISALLKEATPERMQQAGNVGGELLNWIATLGAAGGRKASWIKAQAQFGHCYAAWETGE